MQRRDHPVEREAARPEDEPRSARRARFGLAALMLGAGVTHFVVPRFYDDLVPAWMPGEARLVTHLSGAAELAAGALLLRRRTARLGAISTLAVLVGVYPANVQMAVDAGIPDDAADWVAWLRLPLQFPLFVWAIRVARSKRADAGCNEGDVTPVGTWTWWSSRASPS